MRNDVGVSCALLSKKRRVVNECPGYIITHLRKDLLLSAHAKHTKGPMQPRVTWVYYIPQGIDTGNNMKLRPVCVCVCARVLFSLIKKKTCFVNICQGNTPRIPPSHRLSGHAPHRIASTLEVTGRKDSFPAKVSSRAVEPIDFYADFFQLVPGRFSFPYQHVLNLEGK